MRMRMKLSVIQQQRVAIIFNLFLFVVHSSSDLSPQLRDIETGGLRGLKSFKEKAFDCSPSGPCVPCLYSEKKHDIYRCSETGYRIPIKCVKIATPPSLLVDKGNNTRNLLEQQDVYVTYRSCIPAVNQEKLSLLAFEAFVLMLLVTSSFVIFRRKGSLIMPGGGAVRVPTNPRLS